jgi:hypothetical protein
MERHGENGDSGQEKEVVYGDDNAYVDEAYIDAYDTSDIYD